MRGQARIVFRVMLLATLAATTAGLVALFAGQRAAHAHKGAQGVIKERMQLMMRMEKRLRPVRSMAMGRRAFDARVVRERARQLHELARRMPDLFPRGSLKPPSEASPEIWRRFDDFQRKARDMEQAARLLMQASAESLPDLQRQVQAACRSCHERYRVEKE